ncbi:SMI1/KNR4 family protein [Teredinibacter purpureus]|uniref:SMI1/KNR4 family protein n=1 Tax=Teredinibacter purpureus TaxID=2731756 RepID=UPI000696CFEA|nr:SMI1/KNR4 family protein [Teredinibacter purpureus]
MSHKYNPDQLPAGFKYPEAFKADTFADNGLFPWVGIDCDSKVGQMLLGLVKEAGNNLIPFASLELGDGDAACFDGNDVSGDPSVIMLILDGSSRAYGFSDFNEWLIKAKQDANKYCAQ